MDWLHRRTHDESAFELLKRALEHRARVRAAISVVCHGYFAVVRVAHEDRNTDEFRRATLRSQSTSGRRLLIIFGRFCIILLRVAADFYSPRRI
jgi:hypothetical protein